MKAEDYGWECPNCHSDDYEEIMHCATFHTDPSSMEHYFTNPMKCLECGEVWDEVYLLVAAYVWRLVHYVYYMLPRCMVEVLEGYA